MAANFGSYNFQRSYSYSLVTCILNVDPRVPGWQRILSEVLSSIRGVNNFKMDPNGLVEVSGTVHPNLLLERIWRTGRHAEIISVQYGDCSSHLYTLEHHAGQGHDYRGYGRYTNGRLGGLCGNGFEEGMEYAACNGRSYGGYWNHPPRPSHNRPFAGLAESIRPSSSPRWFWH